MNKEWPIWEVFVRSKQGLDHKPRARSEAPRPRRTARRL